MTNGLLERGMPPEQPAPEMQAPVAEPTQDQAPDPKVQEHLDMFLANGINMIHDDKMDDTIKGIVDSEDPVTAISNMTLMIVSRLEGDMERRNIELPLEYVGAAADSLMGEIIQVAEMSGLEPLTDEEKYTAYSIAVSKYIDQAVKEGKITTEQLQRMAEQAKQTPEGQKIMEGSEGAFDAGQAAPGAAPAPGGAAPVALGSRGV